LQKENIQHITTKTPPDHLSWLVKTKENLRTIDGLKIEVWELNHSPDEKTLSTWAKHFRHHYCKDDNIDTLRKHTSFSRSKYLLEFKFPSQSDDLGPATRSGDFAEILVADFVEYILNFWVPRLRYDKKAIKNESTKGIDVLGFKIISDDPKNHAPEDILITFEAKANLGKNKLKNVLQKSICGSSKDLLRKAESLSATREKLLDENNEKGADIIGRFQDTEARPYKHQYGASAIISENNYNKDMLCLTETSSHVNRDSLILLVIKGKDLMNLTHELYRRAADEA